jgi:hypothetical protein
MNRIIFWGALLLALPILNALIRWVAIHVLGEEIGRRALAKQPDQIRLTNASSSAWKKPDLAVGLTRSLVTMSFEDAGAYTVPEMPGLVLRLLVQPKECLMGIVYEHPKAGTWLELVTRYADGTSASFSSMRPTGLNPPPGHMIVNAPGASPENLHARSLQERPKGVMKPVSRFHVVRMFEEGYAESIAARKKMGVSVSEVAAVASRKAA